MKIKIYLSRTISVGSGCRGILPFRPAKWRFTKLGEGAQDIPRGFGRSALDNTTAFQIRQKNAFGFGTSIGHLIPKFSIFLISRSVDATLKGPPNHVRAKSPIWRQPQNLKGRVHIEVHHAHWLPMRNFGFPGGVANITGTENNRGVVAVIIHHSPRRRQARITPRRP